MGGGRHLFCASFAIWGLASYFDYGQAGCGNDVALLGLEVEERSTYNRLLLCALYIYYQIEIT
jgi:hypothetical protein